MDEKSKILLAEIKTGLKHSNVIRFDVSAYGEQEEITRRTAQRRLKKVRTYTDLYFRRKGEFTYISEHSAFDWQAILHDDAKYIGLFFEKNDTENDTKNDISGHTNGKYGGAVQLGAIKTPDIAVAIYIFIYIDPSVDPRSIKDLDIINGASFCRFVVSDNEVHPDITFETPQNGFSELSAMVAYVCKLNPLFMLDEENKLVEKLFRGGVTADQVYRRYARDQHLRPNFWYSGYWKGKKNAWPTIKDLLQTWEKSADYTPAPYDHYPPFAKIIETFKEVMTKYRRDNAKEACAVLAEHGYDEILKHIEGGYMYLTRIPAKKMEILIAKALKEMREGAVYDNEL